MHRIHTKHQINAAEPEIIIIIVIITGSKEGTVLFNDALNTFLFTVIWRQT